MLNRPRIIPTLLLDDGNLVKTKQFKKPNYLGDPINALKIFNEKCVDELAVLDISVSRKKGNINFSLLSDMASEAFMPLSYGGGIKNIDEVAKLISMGFEKVIINTSLVRELSLITEAANRFGSQSVVASIDYKSSWGQKKCYIADGTEKTKYNPVELAKLAQDAGAGEILLYSIERDGMRTGYDLEMQKSVVDNTSVPVIACGGANGVNDIKTCLDKTGCHAVAAGSIFVYYGKKDAVLINYPTEQEMIDAGIYSGE